jgi:hypothetical protein
MSYDPSAEPVDWNAYRACSTCLAKMGKPCFSRSGKIVGGQPDGIRTALPAPHGGRKLRVKR